MKIAVAGATGRVGRHAVDVLEEQGHEVIPVARSVGVDVITGEGLAAPLEGVEAVIDATTGPSPEPQPATHFFATATRNIQQLGARAGVGRIVVVSIIGVDRSAGGYGAAKRAHEQAMQEGPVPARILRAAQFHEFVPQLMDWGRQNGTVYVPRMRTQLVAARVVAEALADLATAPQSATSPVPELAGPREENIAEMARLFASRHADAPEIEEVSNPDDPQIRLYEDGGLLAGPHAVLAGPTFEEWLGSETS
jgi:uncharacterized protein YbjT (DUF2867 family)